MGALLKVSNLEKKYYLSKSQYQHVLKGVSFELNKGELVALVGESGSGKTTLLNIIGGLDSDYLGSVIVKNKFIRDYNEKQIDDYRKKRIGFIFQNYNLISHMTILENVMISIQMTNTSDKEREQRAYELLDLVGLSDHAKKIPPQLSGGQKQRVAIARALANNPSIILADEPTGALDKQAEAVVLNILKKIVAAGKLVIVVTHSSVVASHCNRIIHIDDGVVASDKKNGAIKIDGEYEKVIMPKALSFKQLAKLSYRNLKQKLSRTFLVSIGISIGIAAVILILALSSGLTNYVNDLYGDDIASNQITALNQNDAEIPLSLISKVDEIEGIKSVIESSYVYTIKYRDTNDISSSIYQLGSYYSDFYPQMLYGTLPKSNGYIIINETMALAISDDTIIAAIGKEITLTVSNTDYNFIVAGIFSDQSNYPHKERAYVSNSDFRTMKPSVATNVLYITIKDLSYLEVVLDDLSAIGFNTYQADDSAKTLLNYINIGTAVLAGLTALSMIVSAIMIFIVLYISIIERTKEIGILRAIGGSRIDIRNMIVIEAFLIGLLGGIIAVTLAIAVTVIANVFTSITLDFNMIQYNVGYYLIGIILSIIIATLSGLMPAIKASNFDPVEALRYE